jgi:GGDEF domain-containing protein
LEHATGVAEKILNAISAECMIAGQKLSITQSIGISVFPDHGLDRWRPALNSSDFALRNPRQKKPDIPESRVWRGPLRRVGKHGSMPGQERQSRVLFLQCK